MRTLEQIRTRLQDSSTEEDEKRGLVIGLGQHLDEQVSKLRLVYDLAILEARRHRPNDPLMKEIASLAWVIGSNTKFDALPYFQFNLPRLRMIAREFLFPWPKDPIIWRMAEGEPCDYSCIHCFNDMHERSI
jgi:hypothetical protein